MKARKTEEEKEATKRARNERWKAKRHEAALARAQRRAKGKKGQFVVPSSEEEEEPAQESEPEEPEARTSQTSERSSPPAGKAGV